MQKFDYPQNLIFEKSEKNSRILEREIPVSEYANWMQGLRSPATGDSRILASQYTTTTNRGLEMRTKLLANEVIRVTGNKSAHLSLSPSSRYAREHTTSFAVLPYLYVR